MIRAVFFDLGKVLVDFDWEPAFKRAAVYCNGDMGVIARWMATTPHACNYECGRITSHQFFEQVRVGIGFRGRFEDFNEIWSDIFVEIPETVALLRKIKATNHLPVGLLSNTNEMHIDWVTPRFDFMRLFDVTVYSYVEGAAKPDAEIYRRALAKVGVKPQEAFFTDDRPDNIAGALAVGMDAVPFTNAAALREELAKRGVLPKERM